MSWTSFLQLKNRIQFSPIIKLYSKLSLYQTPCTCPCNIPTVTCFALNLQLLHPNNWPTMVYRLSKSFVSCKHSAHTKTKPRLVLHFCPGFHFLLTYFIPTIHPNSLFRFCLLWIHSISLEGLFFLPLLRNLGKNYTQPWHNSRLPNPCVGKKKKKQTTPWQN